MLQKIAALGVKRTLFLSIVLALAVAGTVTAFAVTREVKRAIHESMRKRGEADARVIAAEISDALAEHRDEKIAEEIESAWDEGAFSYVVVLRADRTVAAKRLARSYKKTAEDAIAVHQAEGMAPVVHADVDVAFTRPVTATWERPSGGREERTVGWVLLGLSGSDLQDQ